MSKGRVRFVQILSFVALFLLFIGVAFFLSKQPPPPTTDENIAKLYILDENYEMAAKILRKLAKKEPENTEARLLLSQALAKQEKKTAAREALRALYQKNPNNEEIASFYGEVSLASRDYAKATALFEELAKHNPRDAYYHSSLARAYYLSGDNLKAAETYRYMVNNGLDAKRAKTEFAAIYGLPSYDPNHPLSEPNKRQKEHEKKELLARTRGDNIEILTPDGWKPFYLHGMNLSGAAPGYYPSNPKKDYPTYARWIKEIAAMNCNVIRLYTLSAPAFYNALKDHNAKSEKKLWLMQEVWLPERNPRLHSIKEAFNLYDSSWTAEFKDDISQVIDVLHGNANVPHLRGKVGGIYFADVSDYVIGIALGKELETYVAIETNEKNPTITSYKGKYISLEKGNSTEAWFAQMCDFTAEYEIETYGAQRPITVVNAPQFDPLHHISESTHEEENVWRRKYGLEALKPDRLDFQSDYTELDVTRFQVSDLFLGGLFACYHIYPFWPDFMWADKNLRDAKDRLGRNPFYGYLVALKERHKDFPIIAGEYGVSTSWYPSYNAVDSWNMGGNNEQEQAALLDRWTDNLVDAHYAGGIVFQYLDEWWHSATLLSVLRTSNSRALWFSVIDAESNFGLLTFHSPDPRPLLRGDKKEWKNAKKMVSSSIFHSHQPGDLKRLYASSDFAYLYIRIDVEPFEDESYKQREYWIALSTLPGSLGSHFLPVGGINLELGANYLVHLKGEEDGRLLISKEYDPYFKVEGPEYIGGETISRKNTITQYLVLDSPFEELLLPTQTSHIGRDGTLYPAPHSNLSVLRYGNADPSSKTFDSLAAWHFDAKNGLIELRIPWMSLFVVDPPNRGVMYDIAFRGGRDEVAVYPKKTKGISMISLTKQPDGKIITLPRAKEGFIAAKKTPIYTWKEWSLTPPYVSQFKKAYYTLQKKFDPSSLKQAEVTHE